MNRLPPPHSDDAEQAVLGALLLDSSELERIAQILKPEDFYDSRRAEAFAAMVGLQMAGRVVDVVVLQDFMQQCGRWSTVLEQELADYVATVPSAAGVLDYVRIVKEHADRRRAQTLGRRLQAAAASPGGAEEISTIIEEIRGYESLGHRATRDALCFRRVDEFEEDGDSEGVRSICRGVLAEGAFSLLVAKPKLGKSVFAFALLGALERGERFLGLETERCFAVYLSEERSSTIRQKAARFGVSKTLFLTREGA